MVAEKIDISGRALWCLAEITVGFILKIEDSNFDRNGKQHQLYGLAVSAKRYVVYKRKKDNIEIIKPSEHG
ncbi:MAG TPA: hypothetical protein VMG82_12970, partial [Candidatus Sulfotelmatobacter sp.]|nr:hypothetical protein [Candidatus Sulfotelmatobacter sp.]